MFESDALSEAGWRRFVAQPHGENATLASASARAGRCVLVTGAGGSIGSALVKALAGAGVERLLLLDSSELSLFELQADLASAFRNVSFEAALGSIDDDALLDSLFSRHRVDLVYHAAAWKQVPLLESNPFAAVCNNGLGTHKLAQAAMRAGVPKLVLISTDKAVNPRSIMGVSKRIAELAVVSLSGAACRMNAIRLCNVIGSSGSVVPLFLRQIALREPVTVTDREASRWFLTMREAVEAILAGGAFPQHGRILLPPVGEAVRIADLARFLIRSAGDVGEVTYIGLRPGDKLEEELVFDSERKLGLEGRLTVVETPRLSAGELSAFIDELAVRNTRRDLHGLVRAIQAVIPEYVPSNQLCEQTASAAGPA
jgi:FlaA1/EpsC-like NDP-sugar epimerase